MLGCRRREPRGRRDVDVEVGVDLDERRYRGQPIHRVTFALERLPRDNRPLEFRVLFVRATSGSSFSGRGVSIAIASGMNYLHVRFLTAALGVFCKLDLRRVAIVEPVQVVTARAGLGDGEGRGTHPVGTCPGEMFGKRMATTGSPALLSRLARAA